MDIGGRQIYLDSRGSSADGTPTVILVSGYHDSSDVWNQSDVLSLISPAVGPSVQVALAGTHRVCSYDRPGTLRYIEGLPLTDRSTPVAQPRSAMDIVAEPHAVLAAAGVPEPYVLVGHSFGGLVVLLYGQTYPEQLAGIVFVDAFSPTVPELFGDKWPIYRDQLLNPPADQAPLDAFAQSRLGNRRPGRQRSPGACGADSARHAVGRVDQDGVVRRLTSVPGLQADETNALYEQAQDSFIALASGTPRIIATGSDHYIQFSQPDLVVAATNLEVGRAGG